MKKRIFDISYRAQIESGEFGLETRDGKPARIICWERAGYEKDYPIVALIKEGAWEEPLIYRKDGTVAANAPEYALHVLIPADFDGIEEAYEQFRKTHISTVSKLACFEGGVRYAERRERALDRSNLTYVRGYCETEIERLAGQTGLCENAIRETYQDVIDCIDSL